MSSRHRPRAVLVFNPSAGHGQCDIHALVRMLTERGFDTELVHTHGERTIARLRAHVTNRTALVVCVGGDGTLHLVANALALRDVPVLLIPCGTGNDFAGTLDLPNQLRDALELVKQGSTKRVDLGWVNGRFFVNVASLGMSARVADGVKRSAKRRFGKWAYVAEALRQARKKPVEPLQIRIGNETQAVQAYQVSVANGQRFGGGWRVTREARPDDAMLDVAVVEAGKLHRPTDLISGATMLEAMADRMLHTPRLDIEADHDLLANLDGESLKLRPPLHFRVMPGALTVFAPAPH